MEDTMPNWVYNNLTISPDSEAGGTIKDVAALVEQVSKPYTIKTTKLPEKEIVDHTVEEPFSFWNIVRPEGEDLEKYDGSISAGGSSPFWYDWNINNWGCKWDASDVEFSEYSPDHKQYTFSTPWGPPLEVLKSLSEQHPNLHIELEWEEEQGFGGTFVFRDGEATETNYYDIPSSHADYVERDREDQCVCTWIDDPESFYSDCPSAVKNEQAISPDELEVEAMI
jgi:hypothetical protein